jgi:hypothetical protein
MFILDTGSEGGAAGPFLAWSARGTQDGSVPPRSFYVRDGGAKTPMDATKGIVIDIEDMKTGWQHSEGIAGVAPEWKWNPSPAQMMPSPGEGWKKGFSIKCAIGGGKTATWEQSGAAVWQALTELAPKLAQQPSKGQLPVVRMIDAQLLQFKKGSTVVPVLEIVKWVDRPDALKEGAAAGIALAPTPAPAPAPVQAVPAVELDDAEF